DFFQSQYPLLDEYWQATSYGLMSVRGEATEWLTLPRTYAEYRNGEEGWRQNGTLFARDCVAAARNAGYDLNTLSGVNMVTNAFQSEQASGGYYCEPKRCWRTTWLPPWGWQDLSV